MSELFNIRLSDRDQWKRKQLENHYGHPWTFADIIRRLMDEELSRITNDQIVSGAEAELRHFVLGLNNAAFMPNAKTFTPLALKLWKARRKTYAAQEIAEAFANLTREPDQWQLRNNGFRPLSWWLEKDDRIETMKNCHLKASGKGSPIPQL